MKSLISEPEQECTVSAVSRNKSKSEISVPFMELQYNGNINHLFVWAKIRLINYIVKL